MAFAKETRIPGYAAQSDAGSYKELSSILHNSSFAPLQNLLRGLLSRIDITAFRRQREVVVLLVGEKYLSFATHLIELKPDREIEMRPRLPDLRGTRVFGYGRGRAAGLPTGSFRVAKSYCCCLETGLPARNMSDELPDVLPNEENAGLHDAPTWRTDWHDDARQGIHSAKKERGESMSARSCYNSACDQFTICYWGLWAVKAESATILHPVRNAHCVKSAIVNHDTGFA
jgi:hypothetical protein